MKKSMSVTGDAVNTMFRLRKLGRDGFRSYIEMLKRFIARVGEDVTLYPAHLPLAMNIQYRKNLVVILEELLAGNTRATHLVRPFLQKRNNDPDVRMHYYNNTCIV